MKRIFALLALIVLAGACKTDKLVLLQQWLQKGSNGNIDREAFASAPLTKEEADTAAALICDALLGEVVKANENAWEDLEFKTGDKVMKFAYKIFGEKPEDGRSLYISLHGGGNTTAQVNDQQWQNQQRLYAPKEGLYFVPRAAVNDWNMWFQPHIDTLFDAVIQTAVALHDVNPDKVYVMGYSAGGDGIYRLAPRSADRWAAAAMMAGHPGDVSPLGLRNIGFTLWMGGDDAAYNRNQLAAVFAQRLDSLQQADPGGYVHDVHILPGFPHWMNRLDSVAVPWMAQFRRDPLPTKVAWHQDEMIHTSFYWLAVPDGEARKDAEVIVEREGNTFTIVKNDYKTLYIGLNDAMIDFEQPVTVKQGDQVLLEQKAERTIRDLYRSVAARKDKGLVFSSYLTIPAK